MPSYATSSPSLRKVNPAMDATGRRRRPGPSFSVGHILGDPFMLSTISIGILAWLIVLVGAIVSQMKNSYSTTPNTTGPYAPFYWYMTAYMFVLLVGIILVVASATQETYQVALVGFLTFGFVYCASAVNSLIYQKPGEEEAAAAGFILLSILCAVWMFYFGSAPAAAHRGYIDSFALHKEQRQSMGLSRPMSTNQLGRGPHASSSSTTPGGQVPQMYTSAQLNGFETSSPVSGYHGGPVGVGDRSASNAGAHPPRYDHHPHQPPAPPFGPPGYGSADTAVDVGPPTEYPYRAKAIYSYEANPDDANEISFSKHEVLEVSDVSGRWWQAKKETGETGIAPSNYLILL